MALGSKDLDRLRLTRELMGRATKECRANSQLPELVDRFLSRPLVTGPSRYPSARSHLSLPSQGA